MIQTFSILCERKQMTLNFRRYAVIIPEHCLSLFLGEHQHVTLEGERHVGIVWLVLHRLTQDAGQGLLADCS